MKHAYLIMAHNDLYTLNALIKLLDDYENDIYIHMDKKFQEPYIEELRSSVSESKIYFTKRIYVKWADFTMVEAELILLKTAKKNCQYAYYHLLSGHDLPIKKIGYINKFFEDNNGKEFISFNRPQLKETNKNNFRYYRVRTSNQKFNWLMMKLQKKIGIDRISKSGFVYMKGSQWFSITDKCAQFILENERVIKNTFIYTHCPDEVFLQTLIYNSAFVENIYNKDMNDIQYRELVANRLQGNLRLLDWPDYFETKHPRVFVKDDFEKIIQNPNLFARKFDSTVDKEIIDHLVDCFE